jgi:uncharacterized membrane protein
MAADQQPKIKIRIESLSDLVFGLALSIGSLVLLSKPALGLNDVVINVVEFGFSFLIIVFTWLGYSRTMAVLSSETPNTLYLNLFLLFLVAVEPYLFYVLVSSTTNNFAEVFSVPYALDVGAIFLVLGGLSRLVIVEDERNKSRGSVRLHPEIVMRFRRILISDTIIGAAYLFSALPLQILWVSTPFGYSRFLIWYSSLATFYVVRIVTRKPKVASKQISN